MDDRVVAAADGRRRLVAYTDATTIAGAERALGILVANLGDDVTVTVVGPDEGVTSWVAAHRPGATTVATPRFADRHDIRNVVALHRTLRSLRPDAVHLNKTEVAGLRYVEVVCRPLGCRVVSVVHHVEPAATPMARRITRWLASSAAATVAVSNALATELEQILALDPGTVVAIPNAVETPAVDRRPDPERFTVGALARFVPHKCVDDILRAVAKVPDAFLVLGGDGPERGELERLSNELGIGHRVEFLGWADPGDVLGRCDVVALASRIEGHPLTLLDAQALGLPIVATAVGGVPEIVTDGENGFVVEQGDIDAMAAALARLAADRVLVDRLGTAARESYLAAGGPEAMATAYEALYWPEGEFDGSAGPRSRST